MTKRQAVRRANAMAGLRTQIIPMFGPQWDRFGIEHSIVVQDASGALTEQRIVQLQPDQEPFGPTAHFG